MSYLKHTEIGEEKITEMMLACRRSYKHCVSNQFIYVPLMAN